MSDEAILGLVIIGMPTLVIVATLVCINKLSDYLNSADRRECKLKCNEIKARKRGAKIFDDLHAFKKAYGYTHPAEMESLIKYLHSDIIDRNKISAFSVFGNSKGSLLADAIKDVVKEELQNQEKSKKKK